MFNISFPDTPLYPSSRSSLCTFFYVHVTHINKLKTNNPCKSWVKYQKSCHNPSPFPREREGSLTAKSPNLSAKIRLNRTHSFLKITGKSFQIYLLSFSKISSKLSRIHSVRPHSPRIMRNSHHLFTLCFRYLPQQRTLRNSSELCKFRAVCPHSL